MAVCENINTSFVWIYVNTRRGTLTCPEPVQCSQPTFFLISFSYPPNLGPLKSAECLKFD